MSNIEDKYMIGNHTINILEGLGYEVVLGDGLQGVEALIDKKNQEDTFYQAVYCVDKDRCMEYPHEWDCGINKYIFKGINDEEIHIEENGKTTIYYDNLEICICNDNGKIIISIEDKEEAKKLYIEYIEYKGRYLSGSIEVRTEKDTIADINQSYNGTEWGYFENYFPASELTIENVKSIIFNKISNYKETSYLSEGLKKGVEIVTPAIDSFVEYFKRDFDSLLEYMQQVEEQEQKEWEKMIYDYSELYEKSKERYALYSEIRGLLNVKGEKKGKKYSYIKHPTQ